MNHIYTKAVLFYDLISAPNLAKMPLAFCGIRLLIYVLRQCRHIILLLTRQMSSRMSLQWKWAQLNDAQQGCMCHESLILRCCCNRPTIFTRRHCPSLKFTLQTDPVRARHWQCRFICSTQWDGLKGRRKGTESAQHDKPLNGSRDEAPSAYKSCLTILPL